ncbi:hypothetical protein MTR_1g113970 [Medicago truncatula]|uniref:Uncharacterized protein n=1 Tax=Medicago truncatula TaxID=3880 RepID=G7IDD4_MEDTR|nr:hypothetical protein MTR_1g113970 [Medicago truncatula]
MRIGYGDEEGKIRPHPTPFSDSSLDQALERRYNQVAGHKRDQEELLLSTNNNNRSSDPKPSDSDRWDWDRDHGHDRDSYKERERDRDRDVGANLMVVRV